MLGTMIASRTSSVISFLPLLPSGRGVPRKLISLSQLEKGDRAKRQHNRGGLQTHYACNPHEPLPIRRNQKSESEGYL
jgi:hypothetical protein